MSVSLLYIKTQRLRLTPRQQLLLTGRNVELDLEFTGPYSAQPACVQMLAAGGLPQMWITSQPSGTVTVYRIGGSVQRQNKIPKI